MIPRNRGGIPEDCWESLVMADDFNLTQNRQFHYGTHILLWYHNLATEVNAKQAWKRRRRLTAGLYHAR